MQHGKEKQARCSIPQKISLRVSSQRVEDGVRFTTAESSSQPPVTLTIFPLCRQIILF